MEETSLDDLVSQIRQYDPVRIILFGSRARGGSDPYSDTDLVVIKETSTPFLHRYYEIEPFLKNDSPVDIFIYTSQEFQKMHQEENPFISRVVKEGKILYEKFRT